MLNCTYRLMGNSAQVKIGSLFKAYWSLLGILHRHDGNIIYVSSSSVEYFTEYSDCEYDWTEITTWQSHMTCYNMRILTITLRTEFCTVTAKRGKIQDTCLIFFFLFQYIQLWKLIAETWKKKNPKRCIGVGIAVFEFLLCFFEMPTPLAMYSLSFVWWCSFRFLKWRFICGWLNKVSVKIWRYSFI